MIRNLDNHPFLNEEINYNQNQKEIPEQYNQENGLNNYISYNPKDNSKLLNIPFSSSIYNSSITIGERMRRKRINAKKLFNKQHEEKEKEKSEKKEALDSSSDYSVDNLTKVEESVISSKKSKNYKLFKEIKVLRNRIAAQKSRDKKKRETDNIKQLYEKVIEENNELKTFVKDQCEELEFFKGFLKDLCPKCNLKFEEKKLGSPISFNEDECTNSNIFDCSHISSRLDKSNKTHKTHKTKQPKSQLSQLRLLIKVQLTLNQIIFILTRILKCKEIFLRMSQILER